MDNGKRKSAVGMMLVAGGLAAAVPAVSDATPVPAHHPTAGIVQCNGKPQGIIVCNGKPQDPNAKTAIQDNSKPPAGTSIQHKGFYCNMTPKTTHKSNKGFFCNMTPKTVQNAPVTQSQTKPN